jgi:D-alanine-D-alanine ligase-like ATP-grasp enzyme
MQRLLEAARIPFVGTAAAEAAVAFDKVSAADALAMRGFHTLPSLLVDAVEGKEVDRDRVLDWFVANGLDPETGMRSARHRGQ